MFTNIMLNVMLTLHVRRVYIVVNGGIRIMADIRLYMADNQILIPAVTGYLPAGTYLECFWPQVVRPLLASYQCFTSVFEKSGI